MREIKFRAWDKTRKVMRQGDIDNLMIGLGGALFWQFGFQEPQMLVGEEKVQYTLMQFTGLRDKNGKEIYEGDVLRHKFDHEDWKKYEVLWKDSMFIAQGHDEHWFTLGKNSGFEIIGNIYSNPDLIHTP